MTTLALVLVIFSAVLHASWNLLSKRAGGGLPFVWLFSALMTIIFAPFAIASYLFTETSFQLLWLVFMGGTGLLHLSYFGLLTKGYQTGDLSVIYPVARGTGPMLVTVAAIVILGERPTPLAVLGVLSIGAGVFVFMGGFNKLHDPRTRPAIGVALLVGVVIATYTMWDKYAVGVLLVPPVLHAWSGDAMRTVYLSRVAYRRWQEVQFEWQYHRWEILGIAVLSPLAYILVLTALTFSPVSYIAPLREISILFGAMMGTRLLAEQQSSRRWSAATLMVVGVIALALG